MNRTKMLENEIIEFIMGRSAIFSKWVNEDWKNPDGNKIYPLNEEEEFNWYECQDADYVEFWGLCGSFFDDYLKKIYKQKNVEEIKNFFKIIEDLLVYFSKTSDGYKRYKEFTKSWGER